MWPFGRDRERTEVTPSTEVGIPWRVFWSAWAVGCLLVLVCYLFSWLWVLTQWLEVSTFSAWFTQSFIPYIRVAWTYVVMWCLGMFIPAAVTFYVRLSLEQVLKAWLPYDIVGMFRKGPTRKM